MRALVGDVVEWLRRSVPSPLLPLLVTVRSLVAWRIPSVRADARAQMAFLVEHTRPDLDLDTVARAYVRRQAWRGELRWHPETITHQRVVGLHHLVDARDLGRGVVLNFMHHGIYEGALASLGHLGVPSCMVVYPYMLSDSAPRWLKQHIRVGCSGGGSALSAGAGTRGITDLLARGEVVAIASDVPGSTPLRFVGRDVVGSFGAARIADEAGCPVVVITSERDDQGLFVRVHPALEPKHFDSSGALLQHMVTLHERAIVSRPEDADLPLSRWKTPGAADD